MSGRGARCKMCKCVETRAWYRSNSAKKLDANKAWFQANPTKKRNYQLKKYGLTSETWNAIFESQGECCAITRLDDPGAPQGWVTDHCHVEGFVRGILSPAANTGLGSFKDDPANLASAMIYLAVNGKRMTPEEWQQFCDVYSPLCTQ